MTPKIIIAGAGIGGLTAALALLKQGFDVTVLEKASELKEVGAGVQLSANAVRPLYQLGLEQQLLGISSMPSGKRFRLWNTGQTWKLFDFGADSVRRYGYPYFTAYRADLHRVLVEAVRQEKPDAIHLNAAVVDVEKQGEEVVVRLGSSQALRADVLIGADGVHSVVRSKLIATDEPTFSGCVAWRGVIPSRDLPEHLREPLGVNWMGPGSHVVHYPLRHGELVNFVGILEKENWTDESWTAKGTVDECVADFKGWHPDVLTLAQSLITPFVWALMVREPMTNWVSGRVALLGDAAHATLPFMSQGAAMAIEDGYVLARCLKKYADDVELALQVYQSLRIDRTTKIVRGSANNLQRFHNPLLATPGAAESYVSTEWTSAKVSERYDWVFSYNVDEVVI
ncbi:FAD-dependent monooxygenase [Alcaligenaceae bacterium]|nr:FAD-dependent monooxygenase [Alcaligenaceae bacterium]